MARAISKVAPQWWDYTTLDAKIVADAAKLTPKAMERLSRPGFNVVMYDTLEDFYLAEALEYIDAWRRSTADNPAGICGPIGPTEQLPLVARLVNDLDLVVTDPAGTDYLGNDWVAGASTTGGVADTVNNVEAVRIGAPTMGRWVEGEVGRLSRPTSGHMYFTLKDETRDAAIDCVMYKRDAARFGKKLQEGGRVQLRGRATFYPPRGRLQWIAEVARVAGQGALLEALELLKKKIVAEGLTDPERKKPPRVNRNQMVEGKRWGEHYEWSEPEPLLQT